MKIVQTWIKSGYSYAYCTGDDIPGKLTKIKEATVDGKKFPVDDVDFMTSIGGIQTLAFRVKGEVDIPKSNVDFDY